MDISLGKLEHLDPRTLWKNEAGTLRRGWPTTSYCWGRRLVWISNWMKWKAQSANSRAIVACEVGTNRPVLIENQLERTDHGHLGQLLTYAGGLDAAVVVWISPEIRDEHRKAL